MLKILIATFAVIVGCNAQQQITRVPNPRGGYSIANNGPAWMYARGTDHQANNAIQTAKVAERLRQEQAKNAAIAKAMMEQTRKEAIARAIQDKQNAKMTADMMAWAKAHPLSIGDAWRGSSGYMSVTTETSIRITFR